MKIAQSVGLLLLLLLISCGGDSDGPILPAGEDETPIGMVPNPSVVNLLFPENNKECNEGTITSTTESNVNFQWTVAQNTDSYTVTLTNLITNEITTSNSNSNKKLLKISRGTPYEWYVESKAEGTSVTAISSKWRFFNEGAGKGNYAPFPAQALNPANGTSLNATNEISLEWSVLDIDNDIKDFEVFFGIEKDNIPSLGIYDETVISTISVSFGTTYFWKVKTFDTLGNSSTSEIFDFSVN